MRSFPRLPILCLACRSCRVTDRHPRPPPPTPRTPCRRLAASVSRHSARDHTHTPRGSLGALSSDVSVHTPSKVTVPGHQPTIIGEFPRASGRKASTATALSLGTELVTAGSFEIATTSKFFEPQTCRHPKRTFHPSVDVFLTE